MSSYFGEYQNALRKYADFGGRATPREFWSFYLINSAVGLLVGLTVPPLTPIFLIGILLPGIAVGVRRLHDQNRSGWYSLIAFIPFGVLVLLFWATEPGTAGRNDYGPDPMSPEKQSPQSDRGNTGSIPKTRQIHLEEGEELACSKCDATVSAAAKFCPECGASFDDPLCPNCGAAEAPEGSNFCDQCGYELDGPEEEPQEPTVGEEHRGSHAETAEPKVERREDLPSKTELDSRLSELESRIGQLRPKQDGRD